MKSLLTSPWFWVAFWVAVLAAYALINRSWEGCGEDWYYEAGFGCLRK